VDEHKLLRDIERLLKRNIPKVVLDGYTPDPGIKAEPIVNGRGRAQNRKQTEGRNRGKPAARGTSNARRPGEKRVAAKTAHKPARRKPGNTTAAPAHRRTHSTRNSETAALFGGNSRGD
jgi:ATP-dependent RNA helicase RhlE